MVLKVLEKARGRERVRKRNTGRATLLNDLGRVRLETAQILATVDNVDISHNVYRAQLHGARIIRRDGSSSPKTKS